MSDETEASKATLNIQWTDYSSRNLDSRITQLRKIDRHVDFEPTVTAIQFLRGVSNRAPLALPAVYAQLGSRIPFESPATPYWQRVNAANIKFSSLQTISLTCRAIFDDGRNGMTGKAFAKASDEVLASVAKLWVENSGQPIADATKALRLLRQLFKLCAQPKKSLLEASSLLERRVGLLKYHADREAAHITLEPFLLDLLDVIHVVAAISVIGAMIVDFDDKTRSGQHFNAIDEAGWQAAKMTFPSLKGPRLFHRFDIHAQARAYWKFEQCDGLNMLLNQLPAAIGYWDSTIESAS